MPLRDQFSEFPSLVQVLAHQNLQQLVPVDLANQGAGAQMVGDIGGVFGEDVAHDLVDGIIALFLQCLIDSGQNVADLSILIHGDLKFTGKIVHTDTTFLSLLQ